MSLRNYLYDYPIVTVLLMIWMMGIIGFATFMVFFFPGLVTTQVASSYSSLLGIPSAVIGIYQWRMKRECDKEIAKNS